MAPTDMRIVDVALAAIGQDLHTHSSVTRGVVLACLLPLVAPALPY